ncbi:hypothetical protein INT45_002369 [Circinella minor]|uniref:Uncharacterized protein n=1 Tax=Circinella minor TaxID=1195481 RepID=A0A8H7RW38_9FUNG|nr:hypothetical protein INT45_002369 [Circinella minor]
MTKEDHLFTLVKKQKPGTDLMGKLIFLLKANLDHTIDQYSKIPTEWPNLMESDVGYEPFSYTDSNFPSVLIEIQRIVDLKCYQRVIQYCLPMIKRYSALPIVIIIDINSTTQDILEMVGKEDLEVPFAASLPCTGWANCFYLINGGTIRTYLDSSPIEPTVALAHFFIKQKLSLISMERRDDPTIQLLFKYAKAIFNDDIAEYNSVLSAFDTTCNQFHQQLIKVRQTLTEDVRSTQSRKRTSQVLDYDVLFVDDMRKKHSSSQEPPGTSSSSSATSSTTSLPTSFTNFDSLLVVQHKTFRWSFVDLWREHSGDTMDCNLS